jgi:hypothetical protein
LAVYDSSKKISVKMIFLEIIHYLQKAVGNVISI